MTTLNRRGFLDRGGRAGLGLAAGAAILANAQAGPPAAVKKAPSLKVIGRSPSPWLSSVCPSSRRGSISRVMAVPRGGSTAIGGEGCGGEWEGPWRWTGGGVVIWWWRWALVGAAALPSGWRAAAPPWRERFMPLESATSCGPAPAWWACRRLFRVLGSGVAERDAKSMRRLRAQSCGYSTGSS